MDCEEVGRGKEEVRWRWEGYEEVGWSEEEVRWRWEGVKRWGGCGGGDGGGKGCQGVGLE